MYIEDYGFKTKEDIKKYLIDNGEDYLINFKEIIVLYFILDSKIAEITIKYKKDLYSCNEFNINSIDINFISKKDYQIKFKEFLAKKIEEKEKDLINLKEDFNLSKIKVFNGREYIYLD